MEIFDYQVLKLTEKFYKVYPPEKYPEILYKENRPYNCLLLQSRYGYFICIPFRSYIKHKNGFKLGKKSKGVYPGLDYTKIIIIEGHDKQDFLSTETRLIDQQQFNEMRSHLPTIVDNVQEFIDIYVAYINKNDNCISDKEFVRIYGRSTLRYFHDILGV